MYLSGHSLVAKMSAFISLLLTHCFFSVTTVEVHGTVMNLCTRNTVIASGIKEAIENLI